MLRLILFSLIALVAATPAVRIQDHQKVFSDTDDYPWPNQANAVAHDPNVIEYNDNFYMFRGGVHLPIFKASSMSGPWTKIGTVLDGPSIIEKQNRTRPWAPTTVEYKGKFYCFYSISHKGVRNSAIGVASTDNIDAGGWEDHGALINTGKGHLSHLFPYKETNAIDPAFITDQSTGKPYLIYGSYWHNIWQLPLSDDLLSIEDAENPDAKNLAYIPDGRSKPEEGSFMSYKEPYYYLWFAHGQCCQFQHGFPKMGNEYSIRVGRSKDVQGPFVDKDGVGLTGAGGTIVYGSNHGQVYAPGGVGVLGGNDSRPDILYYHYLNTSIGFTDGDAHLGWNYLDYDGGWPVAQDGKDSSGSILRLSYSNLVLLMFGWVYIWLCS